MTCCCFSSSSSSSSSCRCCSLLPRAVPSLSANIFRRGRQRLRRLAKANRLADGAARAGPAEPEAAVVSASLLRARVRLS
jgi:hypothetical protein